MYLGTTTGVRYTSGTANDLAPPSGTYVRLHSLTILGGSASPSDITISDVGANPVGPTFVLEVRVDSGNAPLPLQFIWGGMQYKEIRVNLGATPADVLIEYSWC